MVVLQGGLIIVQNSPWASSLDQEVVVQPAVLVVMRDGRPVRGHVLRLTHCTALQDTTMTQQHVRHL